MATTTKANELDELTNADLETRLRESKEELFNLRFQSATGQLENHGRLRAVKKDIARIYTVLRERELGIRAEVAAPVVEAKEEKKSKKAATKKADKAETVETEEDAK